MTPDLADYMDKTADRLLRVNEQWDKARSLAEWRPIETAPTDGTPILAFNPMIGVYNTAYTTRWTGMPDEGDYEGFPCGFWHNGPRSYPFGKWDCQPTHWMPLPTPPTPATKAASAE